MANQNTQAQPGGAAGQSARGQTAQAPQAKSAAQPVANTPSEPQQPKEPETRAGAAKLRLRHRVVLLSFLALVVLPVIIGTWYLYTRAQDQYASYVAFTIRSENTIQASELLGGLSAFGGGGSEDADILYEYIQSRELVEIIDRELDLRKIYSEFEVEDPLFSFDSSGTIEDLTKYWSKMVKIFYDSSTGLIELRVHAFDAETAKAIAERIFEDSSALINNLNATAREDATKYARQGLDEAVERLKASREAITTFRSRNQVVDPSAEIGAQAGIVTALQAQLSDALISYDVLSESAGPSDPRLAQIELRINVIRERIEEERLKYVVRDSDESNFSSLVGEYERLAVDREFAEQSYLVSLAAYDLARKEAQRKSKYLAAYIKPTLAERAQYPQRALLLGLIGIFMLFVWAISVLIYYAIKDRR